MTSLTQHQRGVTHTPSLLGRGGFHVPIPRWLLGVRAIRVGGAGGPHEPPARAPALCEQGDTMRRSKILARLMPAIAIAGVLGASALASPAQILGSLMGYGYSFGGLLHSGPSVNPPSGAQTDVFVVGADNAMWTTNITTGNFAAPWTTLGGVVLQRPGSTWTNSTNMEVYARGADSAVWYRQEVAGTWGSWASLGGVVTAGVDATNFGGNTYLFARGADSALWYKKRTGTSGTNWGAWTSIGGIITSSPTGIVLGTSMFAFVRGGN